MIVLTRPSRFVPAEGVRRAYFASEKPPFIREWKPRGRKADGLRYERKVHGKLVELFEPLAFCVLFLSPWIRFDDDNGEGRWCQPDAIAVDLASGAVFIYEVKHHHCAEAWWQLRRLYEPVVRALFPDPEFHVHLVEICRWFDPATYFPEPIRMMENPLVLPQANKIAVHIFGRGGS